MVLRRETNVGALLRKRYGREADARYSKLPRAVEPLERIEGLQ
jgi:hypothetical protein